MMLRRSLRSLVFLTFSVGSITASLAAQQATPAPACEPGGPDVLDSPVLAPVIYLSWPSFQGRAFGEAGDWCASEYIAAQFESLGLAPGVHGSFFQVVPDRRAGAVPGMARSVVAVLEGSDPVLREEILLVAAHHDHLPSSRAPDGTLRRFPGADDNASGVSALLFAAKALAAGPRPPRTVVFATFTGEEAMFQGSTYFVEHPPVPLERVVGMLNVDMVGRLHDEPLRISGTGTRADWESLIREAQGDLPVEMSPEVLPGSDHLVFHRRGIPILYIRTASHVDHHQPTDDWTAIDAQGLARVTDFLTRLVRAAAARPAS